jgi:hypothetical protein
MLFASFLTDAALWLIILGVLGNAALIKIFGQNYANEFGIWFRVWWTERMKRDDEAKGQGSD